MDERLRVLKRTGVCMSVGAWMALSALATGCSDSPSIAPKRATGKVTGTVTLDGKPIKGVTVTFSPKEPGGDSTGVTDEQGHYELEYSGGGLKGAVIGEHTVSFMALAEDVVDGVIYPGANEGLGELPEKYTAQKSSITREVLDGEQVFDFELESD